ncbi:MAG TPA: hypothetical protein VIN67_03410 [Desulfobaccales bacterium]
MLGLNLLIRLGRSVLKGPVTDAGLLPAKVYRHLVLEAIEGDDFPEALNYLRWAEDPLLAQLLVLRLRLLAAKHDRQRQAIQELLEGDGGTGWKPRLPEKYQDLLEAEDQALRLLKEYETRTLTVLNQSRSTPNRSRN